jgi:cell wall-associated NlpC family hydrolase
MLLIFIVGIAGFISAGSQKTHAASYSWESKLIIIGMKYLDRPYQFGASSNQTSTFDCSSFTQRVFKENRKYIPRKSKQQATMGQYISRNNIRKGDLLFFSIPGKPGIINHVGIYAGDNKIIHTYGPGGVRFNSLSDGTLSSRYITARRL